MNVNYRALVSFGLICFLTMASDIKDPMAQGVTLAVIAVLSLLAIGTTLRQKR